MKIELKFFEEIPMLVPEGFVFDSFTLKEYPSYCGAGTGIGDIIVPETMWGLRMSPACHTHDEFWANSNGDETDFMKGNAMFLFNMLMIIHYRSEGVVRRFLRAARALNYFFAVMTFGRNHYNWS